MKTPRVAVAIFLLFPLALFAGDWPQWRGPDRTDVSAETGLLAGWPAQGPKLLWTFRDAGIGYSSFAIVGDRLYSMGADDKHEYLFAIDIQKGTKLWSTEIGPLLENGWGGGPRGTPTVDGDRVYGISGEGNLVCLEAKGGKKLWSVSLTGDLGGHVPNWGYTESPLVDGPNVACTPGGKGGTFAAIDKKTGKVAWRSKDLTHDAAYSSIIVAEFNGIRQYINMTHEGVAAVDSKDGRKLWTSEEAHNSTAIIPTPIFHDGQVFVTSGYGAGCALIKLKANGKNIDAETVYANTHMVNHHGGVVRVGEHLYGYCDANGWVCLEFTTGKIVWKDRGVGKGCVTCADGKLYWYGERKGTVALVEASPTAWKELGRFDIPEQTKVDRQSGQIWTHPVVANGKLYLRDQDLIFCYDVKAR